MNLVKALTFILVALGINPAQGADLVSPEVLESRNGKLSIKLTLEYGNHETDAHTLTNTRLFNGQLPGPTLKIKAGDQMRILFKNNLEVQANQNTVKNEFSYPDSSNLHFHGAHVSGELPSDDVTMKVHPGEEYQYIADFPDNHMPGTHWIHPHAHGSGALQVRLQSCDVLYVTSRKPLNM
jgi:FtsP/CotA-like multicopper oxidase with cupredoxin domain